MMNPLLYMTIIPVSTHCQRKEVSTRSIVALMTETEATRVYMILSEYVSY